jgi:DNA-binding SARP family transcriptional activator
MGGRANKYPAKIIRPVFKNAVRRERLYNLLAEDPDKQLIWISGPAGFGKTTLISDYIGHNKIPYIWFQFDKGDKDPATFYYYLGLSRRANSFGENIAFLPYTPEFASDPDTFANNFFEQLFKGLNPPFYIVFDNLTSEPENYFITALLSAMSRIPPGIRIAVMSRSDPPPGLSILNVRERMKVIGVDDLRFGLDEFREVAALYGAGDASEETIKTMHEKVEGWVAGLVLMARGYRRVERNLDTEAGLTYQELYDFFAGEIGKDVDNEVRMFLMQTAFLPQITCETAKLLTNYSHCEELLNNLVTQNIFTTRRDTIPVIYQYHSLFREFLQKSAGRYMSSEKLTEVKFLVAGILKESGLYEQAAELLIDLGAWEDLAALIHEFGPEMVQTGRHNLIEEWLSTFPEGQISSNHRLTYWKGICRLPFSPETSQSYLTEGVRLAMKAGDAAISYRSWSGAIESVVFSFSDLSRLDDLIEMFDDLRDVFPQYPSRKIEGAVSTAMLTALVFRHPEHPTIQIWARRAVAIALESGTLNEQVLVALIESMRQFYLGNMIEMGVAIETLIEPFELKNVWISLRPIICYLLGLKAWAAGDKKECLDMVEKGLQSSKSTGVHMWDMILLGHGGVCALTTQDVNLARSYLDRMNKQLARASKHDKSHYHYLSAWASYIAGDPELAITHAEKAYEMKLEIGNAFGIGSNRLALAETLWITGERHRAAELLADSRKTALQCNSGLLLYLCDIAEAVFALDSGENEKAAGFLKDAFAFGKAKGIYNFFWFRKDIMSRLCSFAIANNSMTGYAQELITKHGLLPDVSTLELEEWPWPVKLYTLGRLELIIKGKKVRFSRKGQEKPMALLMAIVAFGGRNVDSGKLVDALWPDSDGAAGQQALATTLHRLRKIIDVDDAVIFSKGAVTLNPEVIWLDMWAVERALGNIGPLLADGPEKSGDLSERSSQIERTLDLYKGHFLTHDGTYEWCISPRERLRSKFIRNLTNYCAFLEKQGEVENAIKWYVKALELENLAEELYRGLIRSYNELGMKAEAISTYNRCRQVLTEVLGVEPSPETEKIREAVLKDA